MVKVKQTEKVKKERNSSSCANRVLARKSERGGCIRSYIRMLNSFQKQMLGSVLLTL